MLNSHVVTQRKGRGHGREIVIFRKTADTVRLAMGNGVAIKRHKQNYFFDVVAYDTGTDGQTNRQRAADGRHPNTGTNALGWQTRLFSDNHRPTR